MLSPVLSSEKTYRQIVTHDATWYQANRITTRFGVAVVTIDRERQVVIRSGSETPYGKLVLATGSAPFIIPVQGKDLPGVMTYRDLEDNNAMVAVSKPGAKAVVIHIIDHLMERLSDPSAGYLLQKDVESRGIKGNCKWATKAIIGNGRPRPWFWSVAPPIPVIWSAWPSASAQKSGLPMTRIWTLGAV